MEIVLTETFFLTCIYLYIFIDLESRKIGMWTQEEIVTIHKKGDQHDCINYK